MQSKRHLKAVEDIRLEMMHEENEILGGSALRTNNNLDAEDSDDFDDNEAEELEMPQSPGVEV